MYTGHVSTASNRADWSETIVLTDEETGELIDISACRITMTVLHRPRNPNNYTRDGYYGLPDTGLSAGIALTGSTDTGEITLPDVGTFTWSFSADRMAALPQGEYQLGLRISQDSRTVQLIIGTANIAEGFDTQ